jgi:hypothetical protein
MSVTPGTLANWRWKSIGPPYYAVGTIILYADDELDAWVAAGRQSTADDPGASAAEMAAAERVAEPGEEPAQRATPASPARDRRAAARSRSDASTNTAEAHAAGAAE